MGCGWDEGSTKSVLTVLAFFALFYPPVGGLGRAFGHDGQKWLILAGFGMLAGGRLDVRWLPWLGWSLFSAVFAYDWWQGFFGEWGVYNSAVVQCLLLWAVYGARWPGGHRMYGWALRCAVGLSGYLALSQFFTGVVPGSSVVAGFAGRAYGGMGSPVYLGALLAVVGPVVLPGAGWLFSAFFITVMLSTGARGAFVALAVGAGYLVLMRWPRWKAVAVCSAFGSAVLAVVLMASPADRVASDSGRMLIWRTCARAGVSAGPWGWGPENTMYAVEAFKDRGAWMGVYGKGPIHGHWLMTEGHAHNAVLESFVATGAGVLPFLFLAWCVWTSAMPGRPRAVLLALAAASMFNPVPLTVKAVALMYAGMRSSPSRFVFEAPRISFAIAALSFFAALYCARLSLVAFDEAMPLAVREQAAVAVRMLHLTN